MSTDSTRRVPPRVRVRAASPAIAAHLADSGVHPVLARLYAARGVRTPAELDGALSALIPPTQMKHSAAAARLLADAIERHARLLVIADYDCDGATACAVAVLALRAFGANVDYLVPDRAKLGYGLTPELVELAALRTPDLLITVDNGIASVAGVAAATARGIATLITDHHLPGDTLPAAACIVNPNQPGCEFPSKSIAGVGVIFYVMLALRAVLRERGRFKDRAEPNLGALLDLVALGTVADVVRLDRNNRILVAQGLARMREGRLRPGLRALFTAAGRDPRRASTFDLGFALGPRLNAAGRIADMHLGIECLITDDETRALEIARRLDELNRERRSIEAGMLETALGQVLDIDPGNASTMTVADPAWHQGVVGIVAARIKDRTHRPTFAFAPGTADELRGSGRSIAGLHLRDCLDLMSKLEPDLLIRFGGHAAAAGVTIHSAQLSRFRAAFELCARKMLDADALEQVIETDGALESAYFSQPIARMLAAEVWGQGFPAPLYLDTFAVQSQRLMAAKHSRLKLSPVSAWGAKHGASIDAIAFNHADPVPDRIRAVYRLDLDEWNGLESVRLTIEHILPVTD